MLAPRGGNNTIQTDKKRTSLDAPGSKNHARCVGLSKSPRRPLRWSSSSSPVWDFSTTFSLDRPLLLQVHFTESGPFLFCFVLFNYFNQSWRKQRKLKQKKKKSKKRNERSPSPSLLLSSPSPCHDSSRRTNQRC